MVKFFISVVVLPAAFFGIGVALGAEDLLMPTALYFLAALSTHIVCNTP